MIYTTDKLVEDYYAQVKDKYPDIELERFARICKSPFYFIKKIMEDRTFPVIQIKYLGKFLVYPGKVKAILKSLKLSKEKGAMTPEDNETNTKDLIKFLKENNETFDADN